MKHIMYDLLRMCEKAEDRYGSFASTHEAMGVALEEWSELIESVHDNDIVAIRHEALDLAAVLIRLAASDGAAFLERSGIK